MTVSGQIREIVGSLIETWSASQVARTAAEG
jgi:hypothetical protein